MSIRTAITSSDLYSFAKSSMLRGYNFPTLVRERMEEMTRQLEYKIKKEIKEKK